MEYWDDYSEYDAVTEELKATLKLSVKKEISDKIDNLEKENKELREKTKKLTDLETQNSSLNAELKAKINAAELSALSKKAKEFFDMVKEPMFSISYDYVAKNKCNKCDNERLFHYKNASGKEATIRCDICGGTKQVWKVVLSYGYSADIRWHGGERKVYVWYKKFDPNSDEYNSVTSTIEELYENQPYEEINSYNVMFKEEKDAEKYANWLNNKEDKQ